MMYLRIFLKVCEGCGALWYRPENCPDVYCSGCAPRLQLLPPGRRSRRPGRRMRHRVTLPARGGAA